MMELFMQTETWIALLTLSFLEIVLGIDNIIFISILTNKLPEEIRPKARTGGIGLALVTRIIMLLGISWIIGMTAPLLTIMDHPISGRDLVLFTGGLFLIAKSTREIHHKIEDDDDQSEENVEKKQISFTSIIIQIALLDIVFSFDSVLTAVGMTEHVIIMIIAVVISLIIMLIFAGAISDFIEKHPTLQMLALSFLILIGFVLVAESFHLEIPKGYIYFAVFFSLAVEFLNMRFKKTLKNKTN
jgi:predicted tellurium resistance membrane protein TerC